MGCELMESESAFREALERTARAMQPHVEWSLLDELTADQSRSRLDQVDVIQPAILAIEVALAALWRSWGVEPDAVVGQSLGEVAAAVVAGALSIGDGARLICRRSRLVKSASGRGAMASVELSAEEARSALAGYEDRVSVAVSASPRSTVLSGEPEAVAKILEELDSREVFCRPIRVDYASHCPQMDPLREDVLRELKELQPRSASVPIYSTVTADAIDGAELSAEYWVRNLRAPVLFSETVQRLLASGYDTFLEISPHPIVLSSLEATFQHWGGGAVAFGSLKRQEGERAAMLASLAGLYTAGYPVNWQKIHPDGGRCVRLPAYPWQRESFWIESQPTIGGIGEPSDGRGATGHPLLGVSLRSAVEPSTCFWQTDLDLRRLPFLGDQRIQGMAVLPASAILEMALSAAAAAFGPGAHQIEGLKLERALVLPDDGAVTVQVVLRSDLPDWGSFRVLSPTQRSRPTAPWTLHASATLRPEPSREAPSEPELLARDEVKARCEEAVSAAEHYRAMERRGLEYGPSLKGVTQLWRRAGEALGLLSPAEAMSPASNVHVRLGFLDACFQVLLAALPEDGGSVDLDDTYLGVALGSVRLYGEPETAGWCHARLRPESPEGPWKGDSLLFSEDGRLVLEARGVIIERRQRRAKPEEVRPSEELHPLVARPLVEARGASGEGPGRLSRRGLLTAGCADRRRLLEDHLRSRVAGTLGLSPQNLEVRKPLNKLGLDSMMALSLTNWLQAELGVDVPVVRILKGHSVVDLTDLILDGLGVEAPGPAQPPTKASDLDEAEARRWLSRIDELTEDEVDSLLRAAKRK